MRAAFSLPIAGVCLSLAVAACLPEHRLNDSCLWEGDRPGELDLRSSVDRRHLEQDVRLAEDLGIRHGDAWATELPQQRALEEREACTARLLAGVGRRHGVDGESVARAAGARDVWVDLLAVYLPIALLLALIADRVAVRVARAFEPEEWRLRLAAFAVLTPVVAGFAVAIADQWEWLVEISRLRNDHLSYRAVYLPLARHPTTAWLVAMMIFIGAVALRLRRVRRVLEQQQLQEPAGRAIPTGN